MALSISGLWLIHHFDDFRWLVGERNSGALNILWTDHTYHHPYHRKLPNDANLIAIGARQHSLDEAIGFIDTFLRTPFSNDERHARRIAQLAEYEKTGKIAGHQVD